LKVRAHVRVSGRVQGIFFRQRTADKAEGVGVTGWVRNLEDGRVEAVFEGEKEAVEQVVEFCKRGPPRAIVSAVDVAWEAFAGEFSGFQVTF
jgi:acylphosphatase